jgi:FdhD protein
VVAVSTQTTLALGVADAAATLISVARGDGFEVFTHPLRITLETVRYVTRGRPAPTRSG